MKINRRSRQSGLITVQRAYDKPSARQMMFSENPQDDKVHIHVHVTAPYEIIEFICAFICTKENYIWSRTYWINRWII